MAYQAIRLLSGRHIKHTEAVVVVEKALTAEEQDAQDQKQLNMTQVARLYRVDLAIAALKDSLKPGESVIIRSTDIHYPKKLRLPSMKVPPNLIEEVTAKVPGSAMRLARWTREEKKEADRRNTIMAFATEISKQLFAGYQVVLQYKAGELQYLPKSLKV